MFIFFLAYNMFIYFFFFSLYLDTGFHRYLIRVHVRTGIWSLVYMVEEGDVVTVTINPAPPDARPTGVGNRDTTNKGWSGGF